MQSTGGVPGAGAGTEHPGHAVLHSLQPSHSGNADILLEDPGARKGGGRRAVANRSRDGILGHQFNKRLEFFAPCYSQSLTTGGF